MNILLSVLSVVCLVIASTAPTTAQWEQTGTPPGVTRLASKGDLLFVATSDSGVYRSTDLGMSWIPSNSGLTVRYVYSLLVHDTTIFAGTSGAGIFRSTDNGASWNPANFGVGDSIIPSLAAGPGPSGGTNLYAGTFSSGIFRSTDNGDSWGALGGVGCAFALAVNGPYVFVGTYDFSFISSNYGATWPGDGPGSVSDWAFIPDGPDGWHVFGAMSTGVYSGGGVHRSVDSGKTWTQVDSGVTGNNVVSLAAAGTKLFAGTSDRGIFLSTDEGSSWTNVNANLPLSGAVYPISVHNGHLFAALRSGIVWRRPLSELITPVGDPIGELPPAFSLDQNYPNPFNPATVIRYRLPSSTFVTLRVYDTIGREVVTLVNESKAAGNHEAVLDASGLPGGVYLYRLQAGTFSGTKKLALIR